MLDWKSKPELAWLASVALGALTLAMALGVLAGLAWLFPMAANMILWKTLPVPLSALPLVWVLVPRGCLEGFWVPIVLCLEVALVGAVLGVHAGLVGKTRWRRWLCFALGLYFAIACYGLLLMIAASV